MDVWSEDRISVFLEAVKSAKAHLPTGNWQDVVNALGKSKPIWKSITPDLLMLRYSQLCGDFPAKYLQADQSVDLTSLHPNQLLIHKLILEEQGMYSDVNEHEFEPKGTLHLTTCDIPIAIAALKALRTCGVHKQDARILVKFRFVEARRLLAAVFPEFTIPSTNMLFSQFVKIMRRPEFIPPDSPHKREFVSIVRDMRIEFNKEPHSGKAVTDNAFRMSDCASAVSEEVMITLLQAVKINSAHLPPTDNESHDEQWQRVRKRYFKLSRRSRWPFTAAQLQFHYQFYKDVVKSKHFIKRRNGVTKAARPNKYTPLMERMMFGLIVSEHRHVKYLKRAEAGSIFHLSADVKKNLSQYQSGLFATSLSQSQSESSGSQHSRPLVQPHPLTPTVPELNGETDDEFHEQKAFALFDHQSAGQSSRVDLAVDRQKHRMTLVTQDEVKEEARPRHRSKKVKLCKRSVEYMLLRKDIKIVEMETERYKLEIERVKLKQLREHNKTNH